MAKPEGLRGKTRFPTFSGTRLRHLREQAGQTQQETAHALKVNVSTYASWEREKYIPPPRRIPPLAAALGIPISDLLDPPRTLRDYRQHRGLHQADLAEQLGVRAASVTAWESHRLPIPDHLTRQLADTLALTPDQLADACAVTDPRVSVHQDLVWVGPPDRPYHVLLSGRTSLEDILTALHQHGPAEPIRTLADQTHLGDTASIYSTLRILRSLGLVETSTQAGRGNPMSAALTPTGTIAAEQIALSHDVAALQGTQTYEAREKGPR